MTALILPLLLLAGLYLVILPRRRQAQAQRTQTSALPGDTVLVGGCIYGTLVSVDGDLAEVEIAPGVVMEVVSRTFRKADRPAPPLATADDDDDVDEPDDPADEHEDHDHIDHEDIAGVDDPDDDMTPHEEN